MAISQFTTDVNNVQALADKPNDAGMTPAQIKAAFDKAGGDIKAYLNNTVYPSVHTLETASHSHTNKSVLDSVTAAYTTEEKTKLAGLGPVTIDQTYNGSSENAQSGQAIEGAFAGKVRGLCESTYDPTSLYPVNGVGVAAALETANSCAELLWDCDEDAGGTALSAGSTITVDGVEDWQVLALVTGGCAIYILPADSGSWSGGGGYADSSGYPVLLGANGSVSTDGTDSFTLTTSKLLRFSITSGQATAIGGVCGNLAYKRLYGLLKKEVS